MQSCSVIQWIGVFERDTMQNWKISVIDPFNKKEPFGGWKMYVKDLDSSIYFHRFLRAFVTPTIRAHTLRRSYVCSRLLQKSMAATLHHISARSSQPSSDSCLQSQNPCIVLVAPRYLGEELPQKILYDAVNPKEAAPVLELLWRFKKRYSQIT